MTEPTLSELLTDHDQFVAELVERTQLLDAEHSVLVMYDDERHYQGHDYGSGQRRKELARRWRALDQARHDCRLYQQSGVVASPEQVAEAYERLVRQRGRKLRPGTAAAGRAFAAWALVGDEVQARVSATR